MEDAARVDRCGWFRKMWSVFLPISAPGLVAAAVFSFMTAWNEFVFALFLTSTRAAQTTPVIPPENVRLFDPRDGRALPALTAALPSLRRT